MQIQKIPQKLKKGDLVSLISPSAGLAELFPQRVRRAKQNLENMGFKVKIEDNAMKRDGWVSASIAERVSDIHSAFLDTNVKAVICMIGGDHSNQLLEYIDFELIKNNPKVFIGYSDITVLHHALYTQAGLCTFYGPCVVSEIGEYPDMISYTKKHFIDTLTKGQIGNVIASDEWTDEFLDWFDPSNDKKPRKLQPNDGYLWWREGVARSRITGGCVPSINHIINTKYLIDYRGKIFFIDLPEGHEPGTGISIAEVDSYLADLSNAGVFSSIEGLIIGRPYQYSKDDIKNLKKIILKYTSGTEYPILFNADLGHTSPMITLPFDVIVTIDSTQDKFEIDNNFIE